MSSENAILSTKEKKNNKQMKKKIKKVQHDTVASSPPFDFFNENNDATFPSRLKDAAGLLRGRKNIVVLCGAGISVSCGIPDFRSKGGIYDTMDVHEYGLCSPEEIFHYEVFQDNPRPFYKFASKMLYPVRPHEPSPAHRFLVMMHEKKMLLRVYTQNVDGLEEKAGLPSKKVVYAHGSLHKLKCIKCGAQVDSEDLRQVVLDGNVPHCRRILLSHRKRKRKGSRSKGFDGDGDGNGNGDGNGDGLLDTHALVASPVTCGGILKPNITFFGEHLDGRVAHCLESDRKVADAVIVMGTSLSVEPISKIVEFLRPCIPRILMNRTVVVPKCAEAEGHNVASTMDDDDDHDSCDVETDFRQGYFFDALFLGFCDEVANALSFALWARNGDNNNNMEESLCQEKDRVALYQNSNDYRLLRSGDMEKETNSIDATCLLNHPVERILIFPGALLEAHDDEVQSVHEVVHCDECNCIISGIAFKCSDCFDYDLCKKCHSKVTKRKSHYGGKHTFVEETAP